MVIYLWEEADLGAALFALSFGFGAGCVIAPMIASPFLSPPSDIDNPNITNISAAAILTDESNIEIPYMASGIFVLVLTVAMLAIYILGPPNGFPQRKQEKLTLAMCHPSTCGKGKRDLSLPQGVYKTTRSKHLASYSMLGDLVSKLLV